VLSQIRTAQIQTYRVVSDTENIVTMPRSHRYPLFAGAQMRPERRPAFTFHDYSNCGSRR
jgi:hypothetical protein